MMYTKKLAVVSLVSLVACLSGQTALSMGSKHVAAPAQFQEFKLIPRVNIWGFSGDYTRGEGQLMFPIHGSATHSFYLLGEANKTVNDSDFMADAGLGFRQVVNERIFGAYLTGNYHNSSKNNEFWTANPGLEMLGQVWDINANGYFPFSHKKHTEIEEGIALGDFGIPTFDHFSGHKEFDHRVRIVGINKKKEEAGEGFDLEIGRTIPHLEHLRVYLGGYHFDYDSASAVNGASARATYELNKYVALEGKYSYDNDSHNRAVLGFRFSLGGVYDDTQRKRYGISTRLLDPIEHDLATGPSGLAQISSMSATLAKASIVDLGEVVVHDNIQFFRPLAATGHNPKSNDIEPKQGEGTFENPFIGFTPANVGSIPETLGPIDAHPLLYFAPGEYNFTGEGGNFKNRGIDGRFNLPNGWGMFGRALTDYKAPAQGEERAIFYGGLDMNYASGAGGAQTTLSSIKVINSIGATTFADYSNAGLYAQNAEDINLQNVDIENNFTNASGNAFAYGIYANNSTIEFSNGTNTVSGTATGTGVDVSVYGYGIYADSSTVEFSNGTNTVSGTATATGIGAGNGFGRGYGIYAGSSTVEFSEFSNGTNTVSGTGTGTATGTGTGIGYGRGYGIYAGSSTVEFFDGTNTVSGTASASATGTSTSTGYGIYADGSTVEFSEFSNGTNTVSGTATGTGIGHGYGYGIDATGGSTVDFFDGTNTVSGIGSSYGSGYGSGSGIRARDNSTINFNNSPSNKIAISVSGNTEQVGINASDSSSHLIVHGNELPDDTILHSYVTLSKSGIGGSGYAALWYYLGSHTSPWSNW